MGALTRAWQILLKGFDDVNDLPRPLASAEMALIRLAYASDLPTPEEALRKLAETTDYAPRHAPPLPPIGGGARASVGAAAAPAERAPPAQSAPQPETPSAPAVRLARFEDVVALARAKRDIQLVQALERDVRLGRFEQGSIAFSLVDGASAGLAQTLAKRLQEWTGERWMVALAPGSTAPTLRESPDRPRGGADDRRRRPSGGAQGARALQGRAHCRGARPGSRRRAGPSPPQADDDVGYADSDPVDDDL